VGCWCLPLIACTSQLACTTLPSCCTWLCKVYTSRMLQETSTTPSPRALPAGRGQTSEPSGGPRRQGGVMRSAAASCSCSGSTGRASCLTCRWLESWAGLCALVCACVRLCALVCACMRLYALVCACMRLCLSHVLAHATTGVGATSVQPSACCPLPTAHCPLPIAHCPLPTAHCPAGSEPGGL
jgi:hypothetical protein